MCWRKKIEKNISEKNQMENQIAIWFFAVDICYTNKVCENIRRKNMGYSNTIQQLTIYMNDRSKGLDEVLKILGTENVNIVALNLADTSDYGLLRLIVSDPHRGRMVLKNAGYEARLIDVIAFKVSHAAGSLSKVMHQLVDGEIDIQYMYVFANGDEASAVLKSDDVARAIDILNGCGYEVYSADEAYLANQ